MVTLSPRRAFLGLALRVAAGFISGLAQKLEPAGKTKQFPGAEFFGDVTIHGNLVLDGSLTVGGSLAVAGTVGIGAPASPDAMLTIENLAVDLNERDKAGIQMNYVVTGGDGTQIRKFRALNTVVDFLGNCNCDVIAVTGLHRGQNEMGGVIIDIHSIGGGNAWGGHLVARNDGGPDANLFPLVADVRRYPPVMETAARLAGYSRPFVPAATPDSHFAAPITISAGAGSGAPDTGVQLWDGQFPSIVDTKRAIGDGTSGNPIVK